MIQMLNLKKHFTKAEMNLIKKLVCEKYLHHYNLPTPKDLFEFQRKSRQNLTFPETCSGDVLQNDLK